MEGRPDAINRWGEASGLRLQPPDHLDQHRSVNLATHLLYGDSFLVPQALRTLCEKEDAAGLLEANSHRLQGSQIKPAELLSLCNALPFMDSPAAGGGRRPAGRLRTPLGRPFRRPPGPP